MKPAVLREQLARRAAQHLQRTRRTVTAIEPGGVPVVVVDGQRLINFCGNDYLGLAGHPALAAALIDCAARTGTGSGASHLVTGHGAEHQQLEEELAAFTGRRRALLCSTGYMANLAVITSLAERDGLIVMDRLSHASLIDAARLSGSELKRFAHAQGAAAARMLSLPASGAKLLATDGVFSMDGDVAPLGELARVAISAEACLIVDDAHGLGVLGRTGRGSLEQFGLDSHAVPLLVGTLGKAFGCFGAFIAGDGDYIEWLQQTARSYIFTTALPQPVAAAARAALRVSEQEGWRRERVLALAARLRHGAAQAGIDLMPSGSPIQPVLLGDSARAVAVSEQLFAAGFWVAAIRPPTVPRGGARLRITLSAAHTETQVDALIDALVRALRATAPAGGGQPHAAA